MKTWESDGAPLAYSMGLTKLGRPGWNIHGSEGGTRWGGARPGETGGLPLLPPPLQLFFWPALQRDYASR